VRPQQGKQVQLTFTGSQLDDFNNGVGQLNVLVNGQLVVDIPAGLNQLTGTGDFNAYNTAVKFGPFDITAFVVDGQNTILFTDPTHDHFGTVGDVTILQDGSLLLHVSRARGVSPDSFITYTFSNPALTITSFTALDSTGNAVSAARPGQALSFTVAYSGGTGPFTCSFFFGDSEHMVVAGSQGTCSATHDYDSAGTFTPSVIVRGASTSDNVREHFRISVSVSPSVDVTALVAIIDADWSR
jgi:hypothetical protein